MGTTATVAAEPPLDAPTGAEAAGWERHPADVARLVASLGALALILGLTYAKPDAVSSLSRDLVALFEWLPAWLRTLSLGLAQVLALALPPIGLAYLLWRQRIRLALLATGSAAVAAALCAGLQSWLDDTAPPQAIENLGISSWITGGAFPSPAYVSALAAVVTILTPGMRPVWRKVAWWSLAVAAVLRMASAAAVPVHVCTTIVVGVTIGSAALVIFGAEGRRFRRGDGEAAAAASGHPLTWVDEVHDDGWQRARLDDDGRPVLVKIVDRDERDADLLYRLGAAAQRRGLSGSRPGFSAEERARREALALALAAQSGASVPPLVAVGTVEDRTAALLVGDDDLVPLAPSIDDPDAPPGHVDDAVLAAVWEQVDHLHRARIAHRRLGLDALAVARDDPTAVTVVDLVDAEINATDELIAADVAELLAATALVVGPERAVAAARAVIGDERLGASLPLLQTLAFSSSTRKLLKSEGRGPAKELLADLRTQVQDAAGLDEYELASIHRLTLGRVMTLFGTVVFLYFIIGVASSWSEIADSMSGADWTRIGPVVVLQIGTYFTGAMSLMGAVVASLPLLQTSEVMLAQSFLNRFTPANAGGMALRVRYVQLQGVDLGVSAAGVGLTSAASGVMQSLFIVVFLLWSGRSGELSFDLPDVNILLWLIIGLGILGAVFWFTPLRFKVLDSKAFASVHEIWREISQLAKTPSKLFLLFGGAALGKLLVIFCFVESCRAFGIDLSFAELGALYMTANTVASAVPTPGGVGAIEAALIAVLTGAGVDSAVATSAVLVFRLITFWAPVPFAYVALQHLTRKDVV